MWPRQLLRGFWLGLLWSTLFQLPSSDLWANEKRPLILFDFYHHRPPTADPNINDGQYQRYGLHARRDADGYASLRAALLIQGYEVAALEQPITPQSIQKAAIVVIPNLDSPVYLPDHKPLEDHEVLTVVRFVKDGGSLLLSGNSMPDSRGKNPYDAERTNKLARHFGVEFNPASTGNRMIPFPPGHRFFPGFTQIYYDNGCNFNLFEAPGAVSSGLLYYHGKPILAEATLGRGRAVFISDSGTWGNANLLRPESQNLPLILKVYARLTPPPTGPAKEVLSERAIALSGDSMVRVNEYSSGFGTLNEVFLANEKSAGIKPEWLWKGLYFLQTRGSSVNGVRHDLALSTLMTIPLPENELKAGDRWTSSTPLPFLPLQLNLKPQHWGRTPVAYVVRSVSDSKATIEAYGLLTGQWLDLGAVLEKQFWSVRSEVSVWEPRGAELYEAVFHVDLKDRQILAAKVDLSTYVWLSTNWNNVEIQSNSFVMTSKRFEAGDSQGFSKK